MKNEMYCIILYCIVLYNLISTINRRIYSQVLDVWTDFFKFIIISFFIFPCSVSPASLPWHKIQSAHNYNTFYKNPPRD